MSVDIYKLIEKAKKISISNTCSKHTNFSVGAVLVTKDNQIFTGINIENDGIQSICAERVAFVKALSEGYKDFKFMIVMGKKKDNKLFRKIFPCGYCRQFISEYADKDFKIYTYSDTNKKIYEYKINELLPGNFKL
ncbi:MAG: cytidine deaminase [Mollicutes bacterium]|nr:cytidine deaminase [Mollicutes bacterium]